MSGEVGNGVKREQWGSRLGFILAAAGSAIGLGNIWRFPYLVGQNGGAAFILVYLAIVFFIGFPIMLGEFSVGRAAQKAPFTAFSTVGANPFWNLVGWTATVAGVLTLSFYNVIGGWTLKYMFESLAGPLMAAADAGGSEGFFLGFAAQKFQVLAYTAIFMALTMIIVNSGIGGGIERACKVMMPALFIILLVLIARSVTLPGAAEGLSASNGLKFYLVPDWASLKDPQLYLAALGQAFFSLSLGLGIMLTYGSYISKDENLPTSSLWACGLDTMAALLAGLAIFPALFAMGGEPGTGVGLTFITLPGVFAKMPMGWLFSFLFFLLLFFAAITSAMSLFEVGVAFAIEKFSMKRKDAVWVMGFTVILLGGYSALSIVGSDSPQVPWFDGKSLPVLDAADYVCNNILLPLGSFLLSLFVGWVWLEPARKELTNGGKFRFFWMYAWIWAIRVVAPVAILVIFYGGFLQQFLKTFLGVPPLFGGQ